MDELARLLRDQDGVVSRRQVLATGTGRTALARMLRRGELVVRHPGVYLDHNGPPTWHQKAWAAVLYAAPAALCLDSALRAAEGPGRRSRETDPIHVAVARSRKVVAVPGVEVHRMVDLDERVQWHAGPPRVRYDETVVDLAVAARDDLAAIAVLADACGSRRTTAARLLGRLEARSRVARRAWLAAVLRDVAQGTCSVLEHGFQTRVVRPHGLPAGELQAPRLMSGGFVLRDVAHVDLGLAVELDGRLFHSTAEDRDSDLDRDLEAAVAEDLRTVRIGYRQVYRDGCRTAFLLARLMRKRGWTGTFRPCPRCPSSTR